MRRAFMPLSVLFSLVLAQGAGAFSMTPLPPPATKLPLVLVQTYSQTGGQDKETGPQTGQETGQTGDAYGSSDREPGLPPPPAGVPVDAVGITPEATQALIDQVAEANRWCRTRYDPGYIPDCIAKAYKRIGATLPWRGGYAKARNALLGGGQSLSDWVERNKDSAQPVISGRTGRRAPAEALTPVRASADLNVAAGIIEDTQLVLLRSASGSDQRRVAFEQIANVVGSTVVLLRSGRRKRRRSEGRPSPWQAGDGMTARDAGTAPTAGLCAAGTAAPPPSGPSPA